MKFRITILCDNSVGPISGTLGEHGFSALIERGDAPPLLFDTGQGQTLLHNARRMHKELAAVQQVVLSHGHCDHTGGLLPLLQSFGSKEMHAHPEVFHPRFRIRDTGTPVFIGIPQDQIHLEQAGGRFVLSNDFRTLERGIFVTGAVPRRNNLEAGDQGLFRDAAGHEPDHVPDDQSLVLETDRGLVLLLGCCHAGLVNTLAHVTEQLGERPLYAVIGGTHLGFCSSQQLEHTIQELKTRGVRKLAACHCTGFAAGARLCRSLPGIFQETAVGYSIEV